jgi:hypothetical protein
VRDGCLSGPVRGEKEEGRPWCGKVEGFTKGGNPQERGP